MRSDLPVLGSSSRDSHRSVTAVNTLHLNQGTLLIVLVGEAHKAIASALAGHGIRHDLGRLARWEAGLEKRDQDVFVDLRAEVTHKDAVLGSTVITTKTTIVSKRMDSLVRHDSFHEEKLTVDPQDRRQTPS